VRFTTGDRLVIAGTLKAHGVADVFVLADAVAKALEDHARDQAEMAHGWDHADDERYVGPS
jgi:hypothetical protein